MTLDIGFYHVMRQPLEQAVAQILERAYSRGQRTAVLVADEGRMQALDAALWTYDDASFLPHATSRNQQADLQPILIGTQGLGRTRPKCCWRLRHPCRTNSRRSNGWLMCSMDARTPSSRRRARPGAP
ncbi:hypothetical protein E6W36_13940 [Hankyongella ginsenosidimutans]|uniref:DNA polymerase III subunit chi n=1 Tax=Hankyongella ginsenosidimutans TaxID=1763828 RepID=A0A4D7CA94_9SPHN|nr:DNA polymerase III subunit chi [Hankyongella ginsenosidimutans]QCI80207.1 hypothetical protein E6W36_13940 [Hankyongella ginsenosidimutans]